jgi:hypothetical protein
MASRAHLELSHDISTVVEAPRHGQSCPGKVERSEGSSAIDQEPVHLVLLIRVPIDYLAMHVYRVGNRRLCLRPVDRLEDRRELGRRLRCR